MKKLLILLFSSTSLFAHGIGFAHRSGSESQVVTCTYAGGKVVPYATVLIYGPNDNDLEYQNGRTDRRGTFAFVPDRAGVWLIVVNDGNNHEATTQIVISVENGNFVGKTLTFE